jgi:hypothetical protein
LDVLFLRYVRNDPPKEPVLLDLILPLILFDSGSGDFLDEGRGRRIPSRE